MKCMRFLGVALACSALVLLGCNSAEENLCDDKCECEGCSDLDYDRCLAGYDEDERQAEFWGCEDFYDDWFDCRDATWYCRGADFESGRGVERERFKNCTRD